MLRLSLVSFVAVVAVTLVARGDEPADAPQVAGDRPRVSLEVARERAKLLHDVYAITLEVMHERYFHGDRAAIPARAMEDVFRGVDRRHHVDSKWISASFAPMSLNHEPKSDFEKEAAKKISRGQEAVETIEQGWYRRAGAVSLSGGCASCHGGLFKAAGSTPKFAGLVISVPVPDDARLPDDATTPPAP